MEVMRWRKADTPRSTMSCRFASNLLVLHGLHPVPLADRVAGALDRVRPYLHARGGDVELLKVTGERVRGRLQGHASAGPALRAAVEEAVLEVAPDVEALLLEEAWDPPPAGRVPLPLLTPREGE
jgi:Fe-S cluster biogenesis protein NfuA